jgi:hypothetical protein
VKALEDKEKILLHESVVRGISLAPLLVSSNATTVLTVAELDIDRQPRYNVGMVASVNIDRKRKAFVTKSSAPTKGKQQEHLQRSNLLGRKKASVSNPAGKGVIVSNSALVQSLSGGVIGGMSQQTSELAPSGMPVPSITSEVPSKQPSTHPFTQPSIQ